MATTLTRYAHETYIEWANRYLDAFLELPQSQQLLISFFTPRCHKCGKVINPDLIKGLDYDINTKFECC